MPCHVQRNSVCFLSKGMSAHTDTQPAVRVPAIRDAILAAQPRLLDHILRSALKDKNAFKKYSPLCFSFLSSPLPRSTPAPAQLTTFFLSVVEFATKQTDGTALRAIYELLAYGLGY